MSLTPLTRAASGSPICNTHLRERREYAEDIETSPVAAALGGWRVRDGQHQTPWPIARGH